MFRCLSTTSSSSSVQLRKMSAWYAHSTSWVNGYCTRTLEYLYPTILRITAYVFITTLSSHVAGSDCVVYITYFTNTCTRFVRVTHININRINMRTHKLGNDDGWRCFFLLFVRSHCIRSEIGHSLWCYPFFCCSPRCLN